MIPSPTPSQAEVFGRQLLVSIPGSLIDRLKLPGSLFGRDVLRDAILPVELRAALALVLEEADTHGIAVQFVARPEIFTHGRSRAWLDERIGETRDHVVITDGCTLRSLPGLRNHMLFYPRGLPAQEEALRRLVGIAPELFSGLASQINGGLAFRFGGAWHRPPTRHLRLQATPRTEPVERFPFHCGIDARMPEPAGPGDPLLPDRGVRYVPLSGTALEDMPFMSMLAQEVQHAIFGGEERLVLELPRLPGSADVAERLRTTIGALQRTRVAFPHLPSWKVQFVTAAPRNLRIDSVMMHPGIAFWCYGADFYGAAERVEVPTCITSVTRFRNLLAAWLGRPVGVISPDSIGGVPRVTLRVAP